MSTIGTIRILIQDTDVTPILSDLQITDLLAVESDIYRCSALCCRAIAAHYAKKVSLSVDVIKISNEQKYEHYMALAKIYDQRAREGAGSASLVGTGVILTGVSIDEIDSVLSDSDRVASVFSMGINDNPDSSVDSDEEMS